MIFTEDRVVRHLDTVIQDVAREEFDVVVQDLERFFDTLVGAFYLDREMLWQIGSLIGTSRHAPSFADRRVRLWMTADPSPDRLTIAAEFLAGYWRVARTVDTATTAAFLAELPRHLRGSNANIALLEALAQLFCSKRRLLSVVARREIREALLPELTALRASGLHRGTAALLGFVERDSSE